MTIIRKILSCKNFNDSEYKVSHFKIDHILVRLFINFWKELKVETIDFPDRN